jgi:hypothetical protein
MVVSERCSGGCSVVCRWSHGEKGKAAFVSRVLREAAFVLPKRESRVQGYEDYLRLTPGQKGTRRLVAQYGSVLRCAPYR